ncbi:antibiotic ABC transporter ATP-binding protein [Streptomyces sp. 4.24]|uniref:antibiotic ABC transporter ATP-binding protein n=1 Tax=Streptomyces tritrimontium TaxID=3406573 RepID=UPI003BB712BA
MSRVVVVHGVGHQLATAETLLAELDPALRGGIELARRRDAQLTGLADGDVVCAAYGDLYRQAGARGEPYFQAADVEPGFETELLMRWWQEAARVDPAVTDPDATGRGALGHAASRPLAIAAVRRALDALTRSRYFGAVSDRLLISDLKQVRRYFTEPELRRAARERVAERVTRNTRVIVGHSLGSVVAYETLCAHPDWQPLTLVTLGSPLGMGSLVFDRLEPRPEGGRGVWPGPVKAWHNLADDGDVVALVRELADRFGPEVQDQLVDNGAQMHSMAAYLTAVETGAVIAAGLSG